MKLKLILSILLFYGIHSFAQDPYRNKLRFGLKAGVSASLFTRTIEPFGPEQRAKYDSFRRFFRGSGFGGLTAEGEVSKRVSIGAEVLFNARGMAHRERNDFVITYNEDGQEQQTYNYFTYKIDYIEFPLTINYNFADPESRTFVSGYAGIAPAISTHASTKVRYAEFTSGTGRRANNEIEKLEGVNHFNNSLLLGFRVGEHNVRRISPLGDFRMSYTMLPVFKRSQAESGNSLRTGILSCSIGLGLRF